MTRHSPFRLLLGFLPAVLLSSCAGTGAGTDEAADAAAASAAEQVRGPGGSVGSGGMDSGSQAAVYTSAATTGRTVDALPGGPFDLEVFHTIGGGYSGLRSSVDSRCEGGTRCHLGNPEIVDGQPGDISVDDCRVASITYDPPSQVREGKELFQEGAAVIAHLECNPDGSGGGTTAQSTTDGSTAGDSPAKEPAG